MSSSFDSNRVFSDVLDIISEGVWIWNALTGHVDRSPGWYRMLGYDAGCFDSDVLTWENVIHVDDYPRVMAHFEDYTTGRIPVYRIQYRCIKADNSELWIEDSGRIAERTTDGAVAMMIGAHTNIHTAKMAQEQLERHNRLLKGHETLEQIIAERTAELATINLKLEDKIQQVEHIATHDALTGVFNRHMFKSLFEMEIKRAKRYNQPLSLVLADVDHFKAVNDQYGHIVGDQVLCHIANVLSKHLREGDVLSRWGGEEFAIVFPNTTAEQAYDMTDRIRRIIAESSFESLIFLTCSFGVTSYLNDDSVNSIFARVDKALYQAKSNNRNNVQLL